MPSVRRKLIFSLVPVVVLVAGAELLLRLIDYHGPSADPFESFVLHRPLFRSEGEVLRTAPARRKFFHDQSFLRKKPDGVCRILFLGGSATWGGELARPGEDGYPGLTAALLARGRPGTRVESINCGGISYASYRLVGVLEECLAYEPDVIVVMSGNNEFIEPRHYGPIVEKSTTRLLWHDLRLGQLLRSLAEFLAPRAEAIRGDQVVLGDDIEERYIVRTDEERRLTLRHYERNLLRMVELAQSARIPIVLLTVPSNVRDFSPIRTEAYGGLTREVVSLRLEAVLAHFEAKRYEECLEACERELELAEPRPAAFCYVKAAALEALDRREEAIRWFVEARDNDAFPHRAPTAFNDMVRAISNEPGATLVDAEKLLFDASPRGIPGNELFADQCHPNENGHRLIAESLADALDRLLRK